MKSIVVITLLLFATQVFAAQLKDTIIDNDLTIATGGTIIYEGATADDFETTVTPEDPTADNTWTIPDASDTYVGKATTDTLTNKTITDASNAISATRLTSGTVPVARVGSSHIDAEGEIANDIINSQHYAAGSIDAEHYGGDIEVRAIGITIDGGGSAISTGQKGYIEVPYACTISRATVLLDQSGSIVIDVWKDTYANYPPVDADSITASAPPTVTTDTDSQDATLTGWTTAITAGDILGFNVDSATTTERAHLILKCDMP